MLKFAEQLVPKEVEKFIVSNGFLVHGLTLARTPRATVEGVFNVASYEFEFMFDDTAFALKNISYESSVIKKFEEYEADISSEDWQCFMRERFGDEYVSAYFNRCNLPYNLEDVQKDVFVEAITLEDACVLLGNKLASISCIKEVPAFDVNKRRFKFYTGRETREVTICSFYDDCSVKKYISEDQFLKFMFRKFGKEFADYYMKVIDAIGNYIENVNTQTQKVSDGVCAYRETSESLKCKRYLVERIFR